MASLKDDPHFGLDSRHSWAVAAFSSWFLFMFVIVQRVFSVIYVGILSTFGVTRQEASWPMNIMDLFTSITSKLALLLQSSIPPYYRQKGFCL